MKYYKIGEISKLYKISTDILRYYEKIGLLCPEKKEENGYRYYSASQIWKLGTIRALRNLDVGLDEIRKYLGERSIQKSSEMIDFQLKVIDKKLDELDELKNQLLYKKEYFKVLENNINYGEIEEVTFPSRRGFKRYKGVVTDWEIDLELKKLKYNANSSEGENFAQSKVGAIIKKKNFEEEKYLHYGGTFLLDRSGEEIIEEGRYLRLTFKGGYNMSPQWYKEIKKYMKRKGLAIAGEVLEIYKIDIYETDTEEEFITEIQVPVK